MMSFLIVLLNVCFGALPPTTLRGNAESTKPTTFNIEVPFYQATTSAAVTRRIETGNNNMLVNPSFEATAGTTGHSFGTTASVSSTDLIDGNKALSFALTTFSGTLASQTVVPTGSFGGLNFEVSLNAKSSVGSLEVCGTSNGNVIQCNDVPAGSLWSYVPTNMPGVAAGTFGYLLRTKNNVAVTGTVGIDAAYVGRARNLAEVSQTTQYGKVSTPGTTNCGWTNSSPSTTFASFSADADCPTATPTGNASAPSTKIPAITFASLPKGKYYFVARLTGDYFAVDAATETDIGGAFRFTDGTNNFGGLNLRCIQASFCSASEFSGEIEYSTDQSNVTIQIQGRETLAAVTNLYINNGVTGQGTAFEITAYRYPTQNETAIRVDQSGWYVDATLAGSNVTLTVAGTASTAYAPAENSGLTLTPATGSAPAGAVCSSTNAATTPSTSPTTCAAGDESVGLNFTVPQAGLYEICADLIGFVQLDGTESSELLFRWVETATNSQTALQTSNFATDNGHQVGTGSVTDVASVASHRNCSLFNLSGGTKAFRIQYFVSGAGDSALILANGGTANKVIRFTARPWTTNFSAPLYGGSVTSNSSGMERTERATVLCSGSSAITRQSGSWISSVGNISGNRCTVNLASGIFSSIPSCNLDVETSATTAVVSAHLSTASATSLSIGCVSQSGSTTSACGGGESFQLTCQGPR